MDKRFEGRVAFVTGAGAGLGRESALMLAAEGARLILLDRDAAGLQETAAQCPGALSLVGDAASAEDVRRAAALALEQLGPVEFLVAAAGIVGPAKPAIEVSEEEWDRLFAVNVKGPWLAVKAVVPQMRELGRGSIVLFSSTAGLVGSPFLSAYSASKGAVTLLTRSLALNHAAENIRVNCVCPGTIDTPMARGSFAQAGDAAAQQERADVMRSRIPMGRFGQAREIATAVLYFLSDGAGFTTGTALPIDGGRVA
ncbi:SDR family NAD(P)-dependent oxidoreductase [Bordetella hinzii]|uniref:SDR family NAD(P)-dependent oxidoreductase n=1 Tax=Bordetella hinzii TaxID=103855 RepID=UPI001C016DB7|nr:SDR family oxidoreductase [Bordetella hinzii]QWF36944.1 SDR family oxidoreductase [Bordetella hinzii]QWF41488.1 SDR family oxidoreductase [Bordetella hinzii]QWF46029.1 SDR family oxidoreductase [Bordetella hinzii]QWF50568.1 SDR family oxidoreductase [Bordetella hinzii]QWF55105.1 SDR family oxidoreductase [Bordetella hinzii]